MNSCVKLVENIEGFLDNSTALDEETMKSYASDYIDACNELNEELKLCAKELHSGNAPEAIRLCNVLNVFDNYQRLNFDNREQFVGSVEMITGQVIPELLSRLAEELFFCREEQHDQKELLTRHRLLAWRKDPLKNRLAVLRELYLLNPNNEGWLDDLKEWEAVRCNEILSNEIRKVTTEEELNAIALELSPDKMHIPLPNTLEKEINRLQKYFNEKRTLAEQKNLEQQMRETLQWIQDALENNDLENVPMLFQSWNQQKIMLENVNGTVDNNMSVSIQKLYTWYNQKLENNNANETFKTSLNKMVSVLSAIEPNRQQLIMTYSELKRVAHETRHQIPPQISAKYHKTLSNVERAEKVSKITTISVCVGVGIVIVAIIVLLSVVL